LQTGNYDKILSYNEIVDHLNGKFIDDNVFNIEHQDYARFKAITAHRGPLNSTDHNYKGSKYNVQVKWESGEITYEPLDMMAADNPVNCAFYGKQHNLLNLPGWKQFKRLACQIDEFKQLLFNVKTNSVAKPNKFKYSVEVPNNHCSAMRLDQLARNDLWKESEQKEIESLEEYEVFKDIGIGTVPLLEICDLVL
jgi:hypothetical protein